MGGPRPATMKALVGVRGQLAGAGCLLPPVGLGDQKAHLAWHQVPLPTEPVC